MSFHTPPPTEYPDVIVNNPEYRRVYQHYIYNGTSSPDAHGFAYRHTVNFIAQGDKAQRAERKNKNGMVIGIAIASVIGLCAILGIAGMIISAGDNPNTTTAASSETPSPSTSDSPSPSTSASIKPSVKPREGAVVRFEVTGAGANAAKTARVNWSTLEDSSVTEDAPLPWSHEVQMKQKYGIVGVLVSAPGKRLACKLYVDGQLVDEEESDNSVNCAETIS